MFWWKTSVRVFVHWGGQDLGLRVYDFELLFVVVVVGGSVTSGCTFEAVSWFEELPCRVLMMRSVISLFRTSGIGVCTVIL